MKLLGIYVGIVLIAISIMSSLAPKNPKPIFIDNFTEKVETSIGQSL